jgi:uncharacterized protein
LLVSAEPTSPLLIERCDDCARWVHPAAGECRECGGTLVAQPVSGRGTVFTYTVNYHPYNPDIPTPYVIALVELAEGPRLVTGITGCAPEDVRVGLPVRVVFREVADGVTLPYFEPSNG